MSPVLLAINNYHYLRGGSEVVYFEEARMLRSAGWHVVPFSMQHPNNEASEWQKHFVEEIELGNSYSLVDKVRLVPKTIYSFEASASTFNKLSRKDFGKNVKILNAAMGAKEGVGILNNYKLDVFTSFLEFDSQKSNPFRDMEMVSQEKVNVTTVDAVMSDYDIEKIDLLKSDTQGFEGQVLQGAKDTLGRGAIDTVLVELNNMPMYEGQAAFAEIVAFLMEYNLFLVDLYEKKRYVKNQYDPCISWCTGLFLKK